ncbi:GNAT family N-acetyltransferase [Streptomyces sp. NPDC057705]|uniref:GNAT family N-acetyltransferase n=1 Tax=Streptomyces sp. NPDC057705 TaxID=3346222 RepID=UPI0036B16F6B
MSFEQIECFDEVVRRLDDVVPVYQEVYAEPPYREGPQDAVDFLARARRQATRDGFRLVMARTGGGEVAGFAYGFWLPADTRWWSAMREPLGDAFVEETGRRTFNLAELAVRREWRRQGIAAESHRRLMSGLEAERIVLTVRPEPEAAPAQTAYGAWGYQNVGQAQYGDASPAYEVMVLPLR